MINLEKLTVIDNGRFKNLLSTFKITEECFKCGYFDKSMTNHYRCCVPPICIGGTLSEDVKDYLIKYAK